MDYTTEEIINILGNYLADAQKRGIKYSKKQHKRAKKFFDNESRYIDEIREYGWVPEQEDSAIQDVTREAEAWRDQEVLRRSQGNPGWIQELLSSPEGMKIAEDLMSFGKHKTAPVMGEDGYITPVNF